MHIAVPFDIETVRQSWNQAARMWGRVVANHDFLSALVASPACSQLTLLVPARADVELLQQTLVGSFGALRDKVAVVPYARLREQLTSSSVDVMHMLDPNLWLAGHIRGQLLSQDFPVTGVTHSLGNQHFLQWALLNDANGITTRDCLVCTTPTAQSVVESAFARLRSGRTDFQAPATTVIPLGIDAGAFAGERAAARARTGIGAHDIVVLSLARFNPEFKMDLRPVLHLAALVRERAGQAVKFVLAGSSGDGGYARFIASLVREQRLEDCVELVLDPDDQHKLGLLRAADVFLSLSDNIQETFGLTVLEAMAAGLPVVASDWNGYRALVEDGVTGLLAPTRGLAPDTQWEAALAMRYDALVHTFTAQATAVDLDAACGHLAQLVADAGLRARMGAAALARARQHDWKVVIAHYVELWERLRTQPAAEVSARSSALHVLEDFADYPTARLRPTDRFAITGSGRALLSGKVAVRFHAETDEFLDLGLMGRILGQCVTGKSVDELNGLLLAEAEAGRTRLAQNLLWLYKYGYLKAH